MYSYSQPYLLVQVRVQFPHSIVFTRPIKSLLVLVFARASGNAVSAVRPWDRGCKSLRNGRRRNIDLEPTSLLRKTSSQISNSNLRTGIFITGCMACGGGSPPPINIGQQVGSRLNAPPRSQ